MRALYVAASGMTAQQTRIDSVANNLANVSTTAYKKSRAAFQDLFYQELNFGGTGAGHARVEAGGGVRLAAMEKNHEHGAMTATGAQLHAAIAGDGFFVIEDAEGVERYTRDGTFLLDADGTMRTASGHSLAGGLNIPLESEGIEIAADGTVSSIEEGDYITVGQIEVANFVNPAGLRSIGNNIYEATPQSGEAVPVDLERSATELMQGFLEGSNVDPAEELINLITAQRGYELTSKVIQAADEAMGIATNLKR